MINLAHVDIVLAEIAALVAKWNDPYIHLLPSNEIFSKIKREEVVLILQFLAQERAIGFFDRAIFPTPARYLYSWRF
jgi:hypothetical protein